VALLLGGCARAPAPLPQPRYLIGAPYQLGGTWSYPREDFALVQTGLGAVAADLRAGRRTANGEIHDPAALVAAHRTLQMPAVLRVTNLETGLQTEVRVNDRGPAHPGRLVELSRRAAELIGLRPGGAAQMRIEVVTEASRSLAAQMPSPETPRLEIAAAPLAAVERETLAPPPGATQATRLREARPMPRAGSAPQAAPGAGPAITPERLPERVARVGAMPGRLWVEAATFSRRDMADRQAARLAGLRPLVEAVGPRGRQTFRIRLGPFGAFAEADTALEGSLRAGVSEARILVD
jgi:rare lipoprotein A